MHVQKWVLWWFLYSSFQAYRYWMLSSILSFCCCALQLDCSSHSTASCPVAVVQREGLLMQKKINLHCFVQKMAFFRNFSNVSIVNMGILNILMQQQSLPSCGDSLHMRLSCAYQLITTCDSQFTHCPYNPFGGRKLRGLLPNTHNFLIKSGVVVSDACVTWRCSFRFNTMFFWWDLNILSEQYKHSGDDFFWSRSG